MDVGASKGAAEGVTLDWLGDAVGAETGPAVGEDSGWAPDLGSAAGAFTGEVVGGI
jgi:hypothetical protein